MKLKNKMSAKKTKRLGKSFEYEIRDILREATGLESFERVPTSGAWIGGANAYKAKTGRDDVTEIMAGDIICPVGWRWTVEAKNHEDVPVHQLFLGEESKTIDSFLRQVNSSAEIAKKEPLLVMKWRKLGYKLPKKVNDRLKKADIVPPRSKSSTLGILVAERSDYCFDISGINHIHYTGKLDERTSATWYFFDLQNWLELVEERQFVSQN